MTPTVLHALKGQRNVEELLRAIPNALRPLLVFDRVSLALDRSVSSTPCWEELDGECAVLSADDEVPSDLAAHGLLSSCAVPLSTPHRALGTLGIASRRAKAYSDDDVHLLTIVADAIAVALDNALSHEQLREKHDRLTLLLELTPNWLELGFTIGCVLPLASRDRILGTLALHRCEDDLYTDDEVNFLIQVANQIAIAVENALAYGEIRSLKDKLAEERVYLRDEIRTESNFEEIVGKSAVLRRVLKDAETVAPTDSTVLIYGETGTGKELIARAIHNLSPRRSKAFVKLNCAAIPTGLLESELFGHEKGAFTGAIAQHIGRFELANGGTVFLDEVGEVPLDLQTKLLRVLQEREFERLGSGRTLRTDARLIAATNRDLAAFVHEQKFRADLFYRLNVFPIHMPPLRDRPEDIPLLVRHFVEHYARRMNRAIETIPSETMEALTRYRWPGNIRELQNLIERAVILSSGPVLRVPLGDLDWRVAAGQHNGKPQTLEEAERGHIVAPLTATKRE